MLNMDLPNQPPSVIVPPPQKSNSFLTISGITFLVLLLITSVILFALRLQLKTAKKTLTLTPTPIITQAVSSPSPTTILKEEYDNPFAAPTGTADKQYSNPFEQTDNPFDELAK
ncbi:MAG: hypothetical protein ACD_12C00658G0001 [uncultured bacterium]|nr:MAG: hypothetical protein ACD_12C00658G0001 [uncultured bacterium]